jgi:hypothetical protein
MRPNVEAQVVGTHELPVEAAQRPLVKRQSVIHHNRAAQPDVLLQAIKQVLKGHGQLFIPLLLDHSADWSSHIPTISGGPSMLYVKCTPHQ